MGRAIARWDGSFMAEIKSICVFCGSSSAVAETHKDAARRFGAILAENGVRLIYGGGRVGLMGWWLTAPPRLAAR